MLKREIKYEDFNGEMQTEVHHFHISKPELVELEVEYDGGMEGFLKQIINSSDNKEIIAQFKRIILLSYGKKSPDGRSFIKSEEDRIAFSQTAAYQELFVQLATNDGLAAAFIQGILPSDIGQIVKENTQLTPPTLTPVQRVAPVPPPAVPEIKE